MRFVALSALRVPLGGVTCALAVATFASLSVVQAAGESGTSSNPKAALGTLLETHCGRCHAGRAQSDHAGQPSAWKRWLDNDLLVGPGDPDRSRLFWAFLDQHGTAGDAGKHSEEERGGGGAEVPPAELSEVRALLSSLAPRPREGVQPAGDIRIRASKPHYRVRDEMQFQVTVTAQQTCRVTIINVDGEGVATVVFPNAFVRKNELAAGETVRIPGDDAGYLFRAKQRGRERLLAFCATGPGAVLGIHHDFAHQRFTVLGQWERFLADVEKGEGAKRTGRLRRRWRTARRCWWRRRSKSRRRRRVCRTVRRRVTVRVPPPPLAPFGRVDVIDIRVR